MKLQFSDTTNPGKIIKLNPEAKGQSMILFNNQLLIRNSDDKPLPFKTYNKDTLDRVVIEDEEKKYEPAEGETVSIQQSDLNEDTGRRLGSSPLFTDGRLLYVVAMKEKSKAEKEKPQQNQDEFDKPKLVLEAFDPAQNYKNVKSVTLYLNEHKTPFCKYSNDQDELFRKTNWATNGQHLLCFYKSKAFLFNLETGVRIFKEQVSDDENSDDGDPDVSGDYQWTYNSQENKFSFISQSNEILSIRQTSFSNFKPPKGNTDTETTIEKFEKQILAANQKPNVPDLSTLNVFDRIIKKVSNKDLAANEAQRQTSPFDAKELPEITTTFLLRYLMSKQDEFEQHLQNVSQSDSKEYMYVISTFRFPLTTCLTTNFFGLLQSHMGHIAGLVSSTTPLSILQLYDVLYLCKITSANLRSLNFCALNLSTDLLPTKEAYEQFIAQFSASIQKLGAENNGLAARSPSTEEAVSVCDQIQKTCSAMVQFSVGVFKQDSASLLETLSQKLTGCDLEAAQKCLMYIGFLGQSEQMIQILDSGRDASKLSKAVTIFDTLIEFNHTQMLTELKSAVPETSLDDLKKPVSVFNQAFFVTAQKFMSQLASELTTVYLNLLREKLQMQVPSEEFLAQLTRVEEALSQVSRQLFDKYATCIASAFGGVSKALDAIKEKKEDEAWEGVEDKFKAIKTLLNTVLFEGNGFLSLTRMLA